MAEILSLASAGMSLEERLERCELVYFPVCPFALPEGNDLQFLLGQELAGAGHKNISYDPGTGKVGGFRRRSEDQAEKLERILSAFSRNATAWLADALPGHSRGWLLDRVSFRSEEEATRQLRQTARNDLLHVDSFPSRPTHGRRILRCFVNINPTQPRIWVTSDPFHRLIERYGEEVGLPDEASWTGRLRAGLAGFFRPRRSTYDAFMLRFHNYLKANDSFQEKCRKRFWCFVPGSAWLVLADAVSHAVLRGRYALEHSYFLSLKDMVLPHLAPAVVLHRMCGQSVLQAA